MIPDNVRQALNKLDTYLDLKVLGKDLDVIKEYCERVSENINARMETKLNMPKYQRRVDHWMGVCFGAEISDDIRERCDRFMEESIELLQSLGYDRTRITTLIDYVYSRPVGESKQEVGGVVVTLNALCSAARIDLTDAAEAELARIWTKVDAIREKQKSKRGLHTPLPVPPQENRHG